MIYTKKQLKSVRFSLFFTLIFSLITYAVLYSTLVLFITNKLNINNISATSIMATFLAFHFVLQIIGGFFSGKLFSYRAALLICFAMQFIACFFLYYQMLYWGLAFFLAGNSFNLISINCILTQYFDHADKTREHAFLYNYTGMNIGAIIGSSISGFFEISHNYPLLFIFASIANLTAFSIILLSWKMLNDKNTTYANLTKNKKIRSFFIGLICVLFLIIILKYILMHSYYTNKIILIIGILALLYVSYLILKSQSSFIKKKLLAFFVFLITGCVFWSLYLMEPIGLILFIKNNVNRTLFGFTIPPQWFINITTASIIIASPILVCLLKKFRNKGFKITITTLFIFSMLCISFAFFLLAYTTKIQGLVPMSYVVLSYIFIGLGETLLSPIGYAMIGELIPIKLQSLMMGIWLMIIGIAAVIANIFSKAAVAKISAGSTSISNQNFSSSFFKLAAISLITAIILIILAKFLNNCIKEKKINSSNEVEF